MMPHWLAFWLTTASANPALTTAVALSDCATVEDLVPAPESPIERLALGWCVGRTDPQRAYEILRAFDPTSPLAPYLQWQTGRTARTLGRPSEALERWQDLELPDASRQELELERAQALLDLGRSLDARPSLRAMLEGPHAHQARYLLAKGAEDRGDIDPAVATYLAVWERSIVGPWAALSEAALRRLGHPLPVLEDDTAIPASSRISIQRRAAALRSKHKHDEALRWELRLNPDPKPTHSLAMAFFRARRYAEATSIWAKVAGSPATAQSGPETLFHYALATSRMGDYENAATIYGRLLAQHPDSNRGVEASYKLGYLPFDEGDCAQARTRFRAHIDRFPTSEWVTAALWFSGQCAWAGGDITSALKDFSELDRRLPRHALRAGTAYWRARAAGLSGDADSEQDALRGVIDAYPTSGHAWLAAERLGFTFPNRTSVPRPPWPAALADDVHVQRGEALLQAGFPALARAEFSEPARKAKGLGKAAHVAAAHALIAAGAYREGQRMVREWCQPAPSLEAEPMVQQACYPRAEGSLVERATNEWKIPANLPYAIATVESALNPTVTSIAGARGLMQLMPAEGPRLHETAFGQGSFHEDDLFNPAYNAWLGTTELGLRARSLHQLPLNGNHLPAVIASYNAGEDAVRRWLPADAPPMDVDQFMERISYTETRRYVRRVLGYLMTYRWVYGAPQPR